MGKGDWVGELRQQTKSGRQVIVEGHWTLVRDEDGRPQSLFAINTDVTEKKELEAQFLRAQRMESIGVLAGGIAHDLNNVLGPIMMALEMLKSRFPDAESQQILEILETSADRGAGMVKQVLQFARGAAGERILVQPAHIIRDLRKVAQDTFPKGIDVRTDVSADVWVASADPTQLHQVLLNLCVNARDAMPNGGTLTMAADNVTFDATYAGMVADAKPGDYVRLCVRDTGTGMTPEIIARIFEPFFTTKDLTKGTGLGLSTTLGIVKSHDGFLDVESAPGKGTVFKVYLPAVREGAPAPECEAQRDLPHGDNELVLVVDDEAAHRFIMEDTLKRFGYRVLTAGDGAEACALFASRQEEIAAVLTDLAMPIMDGAATIRALRWMKPQLPVIAATAVSNPGRLALAQEAGAGTILTKPYRTETLLSALRDSLAARSSEHLPEVVPKSQ
jgi:signal transduction histidine kinase/ActR/RegA family two-component response regulator